MNPVTDSPALDRLHRDAALLSRCSWCKELVVATGADRVRFIHGVVTANVAGTPRWAAAATRSS